MARRSKQKDPESLRQELVQLLTDFKEELLKENLRQKVRALIPAYFLMKDLGSSLLHEETASATKRILLYFRKYPQTVIPGEELMVVAGISEWARRVRELRVQFGWSIASGVTIKRMMESDELDSEELSSMKPNDYILLDPKQDREAAYRWNVANEIRKKKLSGQNKILLYLRRNVGKSVTGEELTYIAKGNKEWARRVRELRTEHGWPISTKVSGRPDLSVGVYVLEMDRQSPPHDRKILEPVRRAVLRRDKYQCQDCEWTHNLWNPSDPRHLELHHLKHHANGGENIEENLITLCFVCHDVRHQKE